VQWLNTQPASTQLTFYSAAAVLESFNLRRFDRGFTLRDGEEPGQLLSVGSANITTLDAFEDVAGRTAMLVSAWMLATSAIGTS